MLKFVPLHDNLVRFFHQSFGRHHNNWNAFLEKMLILFRPISDRLGMRKRLLNTTDAGFQTHFLQKRWAWFFALSSQSWSFICGEVRWKRFLFLFCSTDTLILGKNQKVKLVVAHVDSQFHFCFKISIRFCAPAKTSNNTLLMTIILRKLNTFRLGNENEATFLSTSTPELSGAIFFQFLITIFKSNLFLGSSLFLHFSDRFFYFQQKCYNETQLYHSLMFGCGPCISLKSLCWKSLRTDLFLDTPTVVVHLIRTWFLYVRTKEAWSWHKLNKKTLFFYKLDLIWGLMNHWSVFIQKTWKLTFLCKNGGCMWDTILSDSIQLLSFTFFEKPH